MSLRIDQASHARATLTCVNFARRNLAASLRIAAACSVIAWVVACGTVDTRHAVVTTASDTDEPWRCPESKTQVTDLGDGEFRLEGCGERAVYECNFALTPPGCWK